MARRRNQLLFAIAACSGILTIAVAFATQQWAADAAVLESHLILLWSGVGASLLTAALFLTIREAGNGERCAPDAPPVPEASKMDLAGDGVGRLHSFLGGAVAEIRQVAWFRRFLVARCLFLSVGLATPFYAIHAAGLHRDEQGTLGLFVLATGLGLIVGAVIWRPLAASVLAGSDGRGLPHGAGRRYRCHC